MHNARSILLIVDEDVLSQSLMEKQAPRNSTGEMDGGDDDDIVDFDWDKLQLLPANSASSADGSRRTSSGKHGRSRSSSDSTLRHNGQQQGAGQTVKDENRAVEPQKPNANKEKRYNSHESFDRRNWDRNDPEQYLSYLDFCDDILCGTGMLDDHQVERRRARRNREQLVREIELSLKKKAERRVKKIEELQLKETGGLPQSLRKASLEASLRLSSGSTTGRTRYIIDSKFTSIVDKSKELGVEGRKINKTASMPEMKKPLEHESNGNCVQLPMVNVIATAPPSSDGADSLYSNAFRNASGSSRMSRKEAVDAQMGAESFAYSLLASIGWW